MSSIPPADNATRPCGKCGKPRANARLHLCRPCWNIYQAGFAARKREREAEERAQEAAKPVRVPLGRRCGSTPGIDGPNLDTW